MKQLPIGTPVTYENGSEKKSEFIDATIIGYKDDKPCIRTHWGDEYDAVDVSKITVDPSVSADLPGPEDRNEPWYHSLSAEEVDEMMIRDSWHQVFSRPFPIFPPATPAYIQRSVQPHQPGLHG